jgi:hypothetical protein
MNAVGFQPFAGAFDRQIIHGILARTIGAHRLGQKHGQNLQLCLALRQYGTPEQEDRLLNLLELIAQKRVGKRPGRIEPRAIKQRPKPYPMLMKTRRLARVEVRTNGHPKKVK